MKTETRESRNAILVLQRQLQQEAAFGLLRQHERLCGACHTTDDTPSTLARRRTVVRCRSSRRRKVIRLCVCSLSLSVSWVLFPTTTTPHGGGAVSCSDSCVSSDFRENEWKKERGSNSRVWSTAHESNVSIRITSCCIAMTCTLLITFLVRPISIALFLSAASATSFDDDALMQTAWSAVRARRVRSTKPRAREHSCPSRACHRAGA